MSPTIRRTAPLASSDPPCVPTRRYRPLPGATAPRHRPPPPSSTRWWYRRHVPVLAFTASAYAVWYLCANSPPGDADGGGKLRKKNARDGPVLDGRRDVLATPPWEKFAGCYSDLHHLRGYRLIRFDDGSPVGTCEGRDDDDETAPGFSLPAVAARGGASIDIDFSSKGGPGKLRGEWIASGDFSEGGIDFADGNTWMRTGVPPCGQPRASSSRPKTTARPRTVHLVMWSDAAPPPRGRSLPAPSGDGSSVDLSPGRDGGGVLPSDSDAEVHCVPMAAWQSTHSPTCTVLHEIDAVEGDADGPSVLATGGSWRIAWRAEDRFGSSGRPAVLKTLHWNRDFGPLATELHRRDAVAMERLTSSPHVVDVYAFCGQSVLTEFADISLRETLKGASARTRLELAHGAAAGVAAANAQHVAHNDVNPANVVVVDGRAKLNDFNVAEFLAWNKTGDRPCGFPPSYLNADWFSPEEAAGAPRVTDKIDAYALGNVFFYAITGTAPWKKLEKPKKPSAELVTAAKVKGRLPRLPPLDTFGLDGDDPDVAALLRAMNDAYTADPDGRPSSQELEKTLRAALGASVEEGGKVGKESV